LVAGAALAMLAGCAAEESDAPDRAVAKCSLPVEEQLALQAGQTWERSQVAVEELGDGGYLVSAVATIRTDGSPDQVDRAYTCTLTPDSGDERGFRVVDLVVHPAS